MPNGLKCPDSSDLSDKRAWQPLKSPHLTKLINIEQQGIDIIDKCAFLKV
jgi:hypothetical protein